MDVRPVVGLESIGDVANRASGVDMPLQDHQALPLPSSVASFCKHDLLRTLRP